MSNTKVAHPRKSIRPISLIGKNCASDLFSVMRTLGLTATLVSLLTACAIQQPSLPPGSEPSSPTAKLYRYKTPPPRVKPSLPPVSFPQANHPTIPYTIQAAVFSSDARAEAYREQLIQNGLEAYSFLDQDGYHKVRLETFATRDGAYKRAISLKNQGILDSFFIVKAPLPPTEDLPPRMELQEKLIETARDFIRAPYRWGGLSPESGFDCSGLTLSVYQLNGLTLPRSSADQFLTGEPVSPDSLEKGDLVFFSIRNPRRIDHVGIYTGDGKFIHAPGRKRHIREAALAEDYFRTRFKGARRYF